MDVSKKQAHTSINGQGRGGSEKSTVQPKTPQFFALAAKQIRTDKPCQLSD